MDTMSATSGEPMEIKNIFLIVISLFTLCFVFMVHSAEAEPGNNSKIVIGSAKYGNVDYDISMTIGYKEHYCNAKPALQKICDQRTNCKIIVGNKICGDPWPGHGKFLYVEYFCGQQTKRIRLRETDILRLSCP